MADNTTVNAGSGGDTIASDDIGGVKHQRVKVEWGPDGTANEADASAGKGLPMQGEAAHAAAVTGNPVLQGFEARNTLPVAVADGDAVRAMADDFGRQIIQLAPRDLVVTNHVSLSVSTTLTLLPAGGAGVFRDLVMLTISNPASAAALVTIFDGLVGGAQKFKWEFAADGGGVALNFPVPFPQATAANGWGITSSELSVVATAQCVETK